MLILKASTLYNVEISIKLGYFSLFHFFYEMKLSIDIMLLFALLYICITESPLQSFKKKLLKSHLSIFSFKHERNGMLVTAILRNSCAWSRDIANTAVVLGNEE
jgi:hypothetical protein